MPVCASSPQAGLASARRYGKEEEREEPSHCRVRERLPGLGQGEEHSAQQIIEEYAGDGPDDGAEDRLENRRPPAQTDAKAKPGRRADRGPHSPVQEQ